MFCQVGPSLCDSVVWVVVCTQAPRRIGQEVTSRGNMRLARQLWKKANAEQLLSKRSRLGSQPASCPSRVLLTRYHRYREPGASNEGEAVSNNERRPKDRNSLKLARPHLQDVLGLGNLLRKGLGALEQVDELAVVHLQQLGQQETGQR